jgi:iron complex transport system permease protein
MNQQNHQEPLHQQSSVVRYTLFMVGGAVLLLFTAAASISFGAADMSLATAWRAVFAFDPSITEHQIIHTLRFPRTVANAIVGTSLAACGAIMQGTTRNPLADSGLMGISSGSGFAIALCLVFLPGSSYVQTMLFAFGGAALATGITYFVASLGKRGMTPQRLVLAGVSISMMFGAFSSYLSIRYRLGHAMAYWSAGGTAGATWGELALVAPFFLAGTAAALVLAPSVTLLSLGEEVAAGLGQRTRLVRGAATLIILVLTGLAVVVVGPVGFVGLIVPHMVRYLVGMDYRRIIPACSLYGALFVMAADLLGRMVNRPYETPLGIILAAVGVPYFLYLARRERREAV